MEKTIIGKTLFFIKQQHMIPHICHILQVLTQLWMGRAKKSKQ